MKVAFYVDLQAAWPVGNQHGLMAIAASGKLSPSALPVAGEIRRAILMLVERTLEPRGASDIQLVDWGPYRVNRLRNSFVSRVRDGIAVARQRELTDHMRDTINDAEPIATFRFECHFHPEDWEETNLEVISSRSVYALEFGDSVGVLVRFTGEPGRNDPDDDWRPQIPTRAR